MEVKVEKTEKRREGERREGGEEKVRGLKEMEVKRRKLSKGSTQKRDDLVTEKEEQETREGDEQEEETREGRRHPGKSQQREGRDGWEIRFHALLVPKASDTRPAEGGSERVNMRTEEGRVKRGLTAGWGRDRTELGVKI
ncbi:hypothetical protein Pmani_010571 [Petrolisthes manimaculis]|uniref:Uncharacterized protein n=1 Tax=Petrolisthes manimaculis TaxID=1843537 RepID=A0AAE1Q170_9EUCA|nr:hypothetical protein Pmani_010571 [Petrolisthes manimaculis]